MASAMRPAPTKPTRLEPGSPATAAAMLPRSAPTPGSPMGYAASPPPSSLATGAARSASPSGYRAPPPPCSLASKFASGLWWAGHGRGTSQGLHARGAGPAGVRSESSSPGAEGCGEPRQNSGRTCAGQISSPKGSLGSCIQSQRSERMGSPPIPTQRPVSRRAPGGCRSWGRCRTLEATGCWSLCMSF